MTRRDYLRRLSVAALMGTGGALAGCLPPGLGGSKRTVVRFWNGWTGPDGAKALAIVRAFNAANPDIEVRMQRIEWATYYNKLFVAGIAGRAPELFVLHTSALRRFAEAKFIHPIDEFVKRDKFPVDDLDANVWQGASIDGIHYGLPVDVHLMGAFVNTGMLQKFGFTAPPRTRDEFMAICRAVTDPNAPDGGRWGFSFNDASNIAFTLLTQFGGRVFNDDNTKCILASSENADAMQFCVDLARKDKLAPLPEAADPWVAFRQGRVAMTWGGIYMLPDLEKQKDLQFAGAPLPVIGKQPGAWAGSHNFCLKSGMSQRATEAAWKFTQYFSEHSIIWAAAGQVPVRKSIRNSEGFEKLLVQREFAKEISYAEYQPQVAFTFEWQSEFNYMVERVMRATVTPAQGLKEAEDKINAIITRRNEELRLAGGKTR